MKRHENKPAEPGCGFLSRDEVDRLIDERLSAARVDELRRHAEDCAECLHFLTAAETFVEAFDRGVIDLESRRFSDTVPAMKARLTQETRGDVWNGQRPAGISDLSLSDLTKIAAAGEDATATNLDSEHLDGQDDETDPRTDR